MPPPYYEAYKDDPDYRLQLMLDTAIESPELLNDPVYFQFFRDALEIPGLRLIMSQELRKLNQNVTDFFFALRVGSGPKRKLGAAISTREMWSTFYPPPEWAIHDILPAGAIILAGKPKQGKSFLTMEMAFSVAFGINCFDKYIPIKGNVIYFALEDYAGRIKRRLQSMYGELLESKHDIYWHMDAPKIGSGFVGELEKEIGALKDVNLVVIDTLRCIRDGDRNGHDLYQEDSDTIGALNILGQTLGIAIVIVHHTRKAKSDDVFELITGTSGLRGGTSQNMVLTRSHGDTDALLYAEGKDLDKDLCIGLRHLEGGRWNYEGEGEQYALGKVTKNIREKLIEFDGLTIKELSSEIDSSYDSVRKQLKRLEGSGIVSVDRNKIWHWDGLDGDVEI